MNIITTPEPIVITVSMSSPIFGSDKLEKQTDIR